MQKAIDTKESPTVILTKNRLPINHQSPRMCTIKIKDIVGENYTYRFLYSRQKHSGLQIDHLVTIKLLKDLNSLPKLIGQTKTESTQRPPLVCVQSICISENFIFVTTVGSSTTKSPTW